jgi:flagellar basal body-associated protein FliL
MPIKVSLDELDIEEPTPLEEKEPSEKGVELRLTGWRRWRLAVLIAAVFFAVAVLFGISYWWFLGKYKAKRPEAKPLGKVSAAETVGVSSGDGQRFMGEIVKDILVPLNKEKERQKVLCFDLAFEIEHGKNANFRNNMQVVRNSIYKTVKMSDADFYLEKKGKELLQKRIKSDIETLLGKGIIGNVYFTKFIVL